MNNLVPEEVTCVTLVVNFSSVQNGPPRIMNEQFVQNFQGSKQHILYNFLMFNQRNYLVFNSSNRVLRIGLDQTGLTSLRSGLSLLEPDQIDLAHLVCFIPFC